MTDAPTPRDIPPDAALLVVDVQVGFCPGGNLAVREGDRVVPVINRYVEAFARAGRPVAYSRDWHPPDHVSFEAQGGPWPAHCVAGTEDAAFHPDLKFPPVALVVSKAEKPERDAYSAFDGTGLAAALRERGVAEVWVAGLATDYCVRASALDALGAGFRVRVLRDGVRPVDVKPGDGERALAEMEKAGATVA